MKQSYFKILALSFFLMIGLPSHAYDCVVDAICYNLNGDEAEVTNPYNENGDSFESYTGSIVIPSQITYEGKTYNVTRVGEDAFAGTFVTDVSVPGSVAIIGERAFHGCMSLTSVILPEGVTILGDNAFGMCDKLVNIILPNSITSIGRSAFECCYSLKSITIPNGVTYICDRTFENCENLTSIIIPSSVTSFGNNAFYGTNISSPIYSATHFAYMPRTYEGEYTIPDGITTICEGAFGNCKGLTKISVPNTVVNIGPAAFSGTAWYDNLYNSITDGVIYIGKVAYMYKGNIPNTGVVIEDGTKIIADNLFDYCSNLKTITIPNSVISIGSYAFRGCRGLTKITVPNSVISIGEQCFLESGIKNVTLSNSLTTLESETFENCHSLKTIVIPSNVTTIGESAFSGCRNLTSISLPSKLTTIKESAFKGCTSLTSISLPSNVTTIGESAFYGCTSLTSITIPNSVTYIGKNVFENCNKLTTPIYNAHYFVFMPRTYQGDYVIQDGTSIIYDRAFQHCTGLTSITLPSDVTTIGESAFAGCTGLTSITLPSNVTTIGESAFAGCTGLTSISLPKSMTSIGGNAFSSCSALTSVTIPEGITSIENGLFYGCSSLTDISIPESVVSISGFAFHNCSSLTSITIPDGVTSIGRWAFRGCSGLTSINIPDGVTSIEYCAFAGCSGLTSIVIPSSIMSIGNTNMGATFGGCNALTTVTINSTAVLTSTYGNYSNPSSLSAIFGEQVTNYILGEDVKQIGNFAFHDCSKLTSITIPNSVTSIGNSAFANCSGLTSITIPNSVTSIGSSAFSGCSGLTSILIPSGVTSIGSSAFSGCKALTAVTINSNAIMTGNPMSELFGSQVTNYILGENIKQIGDNTFSSCSKLTSITIPDGVTSIGNSAFQNCVNLSSFNIPSGVKSIGESAFSGCKLLPSLTIPDNAIVGETAFQSCTSLTTVTIPASASVAPSAFTECTGLTSATINTSKVESWFAGLANIKEVTLGENVTSIGDSAFRGCSGLTGIAIPNGVISIGNSAFQNCAFLNSVNIPTGVKSIGESAFSGCKLLPSLTIPDNAIVGETAFQGCTSLTTVTIPVNASVAASAFRECTGLTSATINTSKVEPWFAGLANIKEVALDEKVTTIGDGAFEYCIGLTDFVIPNNVNSIGEYAFANCQALSSIVIPENASVGKYAFKGCTGLMAITLPEGANIDVSAFRECEGLISVTILTPIVKQWFMGMANLQEVIFGDMVSSIEQNSFPTNTKLLVKRGSKSLLALWNAEYTNTIDKETLEPLPPTLLKFVSSTQTTATFNVENIYPEFSNTYEGISLKGKQIVLSGLKPDYKSTLALSVALDDDAYNSNVDYSTKSLNLKTESKVSPTTFALTGDYEKDDAEVVEQRMEMNGNSIEGNMMTVSGLEPQTSRQVTYVTTVSYGEKGEYKEEYSTTANITTSALELKTLAPKVITPGEVIVAAESNITNDEEKVGFEWRRTDAPDEVASRSGEAFLYAGTMEGYIHNLTSFNYWRFRPYYEAASGKRFYGNWGIVEADDYSYFEPTVHTYAKIEVGNNSAVVKGYATRGSDEVTEQGFAYWEESAAARPEVLQRRAAEVPASAMTVTATGQVMTAELTGLDYQHTYHYVAYMKTAKGNVYYGEVQTFTAGVSPTGIVEVNQDRATTEETIVKAYYDIHGRRSERPVPGLNIVLMSDGSIKKIMIK